MPTRWGLFAGAVVIVTAVFLALARATTTSFEMGDETPREQAPPDAHDAPRDEPLPPGDPAPDGLAPEEMRESPEDSAGHSARRRLSDLDSATLLVDAVISQVIVGLPLVLVTWYADVPADALGLSGSPLDALAPGVAIGLAVYLANEAGAFAATRLGVAADDRLRELLAPDAPGQWALLLLVALPLIAIVEEFLFRAALIGGLSAGFGLSIWLLAGVSSIAFGLGHGLQGPGGSIVAGVLGFALAAAFVLTGSLWVVIVAHYLVNALEFVIHEGLGIDLGN